jgi:hypothetical protein
MNEIAIAKYFLNSQICMASTWALSLASLILMWVEKGVEPLSWASVEKNGHAAVGMAAYVLAFIQPFMAFFRPHPDNKNRPIFNVAHLSVGMSAILLSFVAIGLATKFPTLKLENGRYLLAAFAAFYVGFHALMTFYSVKFVEKARAVPIFLVLFSLGALATTIAMIVFIAVHDDV